MLNSPSNPTGFTYSKNQYQEIGEVLKDFPNVLIASDEIYEHIYWGKERYYSFADACPDLFNRTITINGLSKAYAMTGWRYCWSIINSNFCLGYIWRFRPGRGNDHLFTIHGPAEKCCFYFCIQRSLVFYPSQVGQYANWRLACQ